MRIGIGEVTAKGGPYEGGWPRRFGKPAPAFTQPQIDALRDRAYYPPSIEVVKNYYGDQTPFVRNGEEAHADPNWT